MEQAMEKQGKYRSEECAKYMLAYANSQGKKLNVTQVQKLLFIAYGIYLAKHNGEDRLIEEHPQAWPYGPVFPRSKTKLDYSKDYTLEELKPESVANDAEVKLLLESVVNDFSMIPANQLSSWSHSPGSPWDKTVHEEGFKWSNEIKDAYILEFFRNFS
jgi:uncharacterized phage-associated protein